MSDALGVRSLADVSAEALCEASNQAFADYAVSVQMTVAQMRTMLRQNDVDLALSAGLFDAERLVGFWLNGVRTRDGSLVGYDSGTAICEPYRGRGWSGRLGALSDRLLAERGVAEYFLEVLTGNETAYRIYLKRGFRVTRKLTCLRRAAPLPEGEALPAGLTLDEGQWAAALDRPLPAMEYEPSWQHTLRSMTNVRDDVHAVTVSRAGRVVAYATLLRDRSRITRLAVEDDLWDTPVPAALLGRLCRAPDGPTIMANNVDPGARRTLELLGRLGFEPYAEQYEMARRL